MALTKKFLTISGLTVVSRILGVVREAVLVHFLGASIEMDAFTTAFKFPSFFRKFFAEGGFQSIFVPYYTDFVTLEKKKGAMYFASRIYTLTFWIMIAFVVIIHVFAREFTLLMAPGFITNPEKLELTVEFTRIIFPSIAFISLSTIYSGILVSRQRFFPFAMAPILVNFILIASLLICQDSLTAGRRISYGVLAAGIFQLTYMYGCVKYHNYPSPKFSNIRRTPMVKSFLKKLIPVLAGAGVAQINILVGTIFASILPTGSITYLYCADRFVQLPLAMFGISMGIVLLPEIAERIAKKQADGIKEIQDKSFLFTLRLTLPSVVGLITMAYCMISLLYGHGKFDQEAIQNTATVLKASACGLPAFVVAKIMSSVLFAQKDSATPITAAITSIVANIIFSFILIKPFGAVGIAMASSIAGYVNVFVLCKKSHGWFAIDKSIIKDFIKILLASLGMLCIILLINSKFGPLESKWKELISLFTTCMLGGITYLILLIILKDRAAITIIHRIRRTKTLL